MGGEGRLGGLGPFGALLGAFSGLGQWVPWGTAVRSREGDGMRKGVYYTIVRASSWFSWCSYVCELYERRLGEAGR